MQTGLHVCLDSPANEEAAEYQWSKMSTEKGDNKMVKAEMHALIIPLLAQTC